MRIIVPCVFIQILFSVGAMAERKSPASAAELAQITERGRMLASYDEAAWKATDAVQELKPDRGGLGRYIARKTESGWSVAFGRLTEARDAFVIAYDAIRSNGEQSFRVEKYSPPRRDTGFLLFAARALDVTLADFRGENRPYNVAVLPANDGKLFVYVVPAQTKVDVFPLGGDVRYSVSKDGLTILQKRQLHKTILEQEMVPGVKTELGFHTAVMDDVPEDTDVFYVLMRGPSIPEWVSTRHFVYVIAADGSIKYLMTTEAMQRMAADQERQKKSRP